MKFLFQPVKPFIISQRFGENKACVSIDGSNKVISCDGSKPPKGYKSLYGKLGHTGIDLRAESGQPVYCSCEGVVSSIDTEPRTGLDVRIISQIGGKEYLHIYEHLLGHNVKVGDSVPTGHCVGWADNTGYSSGNHLHFTIKEKKGKEWVATDPMPFMNSYFAPDVDKVQATLEKLALLLEKLVDKLRGANY